MAIWLPCFTWTNDCNRSCISLVFQKEKMVIKSIVKNKFYNFKLCSGDNNLSWPSRGSKMTTIQPLKRINESEYYLAARADKNCLQADQLLGYEY